MVALTRTLPLPVPAQHATTIPDTDQTPPIQFSPSLTYDTLNKTPSLSKNPSANLTNGLKGPAAATNTQPTNIPAPPQGFFLETDARTCGKGKDI